MLNTKFQIVAIVLIALMAITTTSCTDDLNTSPIDDDVETSESVYTGPDKYRQVLAKMYAGFATTGQQGPAGNPDIQGIDEGFSSYIRQLWVAQEISTDEAVVGWNDDGLPEFNYHDWNASNDFVMALYSRIYYQIALANEFIRNAQGNDNPQVQQYLAEARFLRALSYWHALDMFGGNVPFVTEEDPVGAYQPEPIGAEPLFEYIETELTDIEGNMPAPGDNDYGRADQGAVWTLLTKLYLNAEVYIDQARYDDAVTYANKVIDQGGYTLDDNYEHLFMADNHNAEGLIFSIPFDGDNTQTYGGTTFIHHAALGGNMNPANFGTSEAWAGHRTTPQFVDILEYSGYQTPNPAGNDEIFVPGGYQSASGYESNWSPADAPALVSENNDDVYTGLVYIGIENANLKFTPTDDPNWADGDYGDNGSDGTLEPGGADIVTEQLGLHRITVDLNNNTYEIEYVDSRNTLFKDGQEKDISTLSEFTNGYALAKWKNITQSGQSGSNQVFVDIDFPMFRLADVYLMYAEATLRGNSGDMNKAVELINDLRDRSHADGVLNIQQSDLTLDFILDERGRELYWEAHRRTDLRRFEKYTGDEYIWAWKGEDSEGRSTDSRFNLFPIPASDINSNLNLEQNPGY